jgi:hypothetical protein
MLSEFYHRFFLNWKDRIQILVRKSVLVEIANANTVRRFTTEILSPSKDNRACWHLLNFGQQSDHGRCFAKIGEENVW